MPEIFPLKTHVLSGVGKKLAKKGGTKIDGRTNLKAWLIMPVFLVVLTLLMARESSAVPAFGQIFHLRQPDGSSVEVRIWGDEFYQVVESLDGYTLVRDPSTQWICYAGLSYDESELLSTGVLVGEPLPVQTGIQPHIRIKKEASRAKIAAAHARFAAGEAETLAALSTPSVMASSSGNVKGICLIVDFPDEPNTIPPADVNNYCNQVGYTGYGNNGSIRDYFYDVSDGALTYTNYVPPVYYTAVHNKIYYDNPAQTAGPKARELIIEALNWLDGRGFDFSQYDSDADGLIDGINCFYAGTVSSGWGKGLWPHSSTVSFSADGVSSYKYQITDMGSSLEIGTFCHENGHMICWWPDLYDYGYESRGLGDYCLMAAGSFGGGGYNPHEPCAYLKDISGWATMTTLEIPQTALSVTAGINSFYKYPHPTLSDEYYLVSNRQKTGRDSTLPDAGIAIWHIDEKGSNNNEQMTPALHYEVTLVQADGDWDLENNRNYGDSTDLYDAGSYNQCGPMTDPNTKWWAGDASWLDIHSIGASGSTMTFTFGDSNDLQITPVPGFTATGPEGGPFSPNSITYTLTNNDSNSILWSASKTASWLDLSNTGGTLVPSSFETVTVSINADANVFATGTYTDTVVFTNLTAGTSQTREVLLKVAIYTAYMDTDPGWTLDSGVGFSKWEWGVPTGGGGEYGSLDPTSGYTDSNVMGYNLSGDYRNNISSTEWATTPGIDCSDYANVQLRFYRWLNVEQPAYDHAYVEVSNNGSSWNLIWENTMEVTDSSWTLQTFDISSTADEQSTVYIRWGMGPTDSSWQYSGWNIDDVEVTGCGTPGDFDGNCIVDFSDFAILANQWQQPPGSPSADIAPEGSPDGFVDGLDLAIFCDNWLEGL